MNYDLANYFQLFNELKSPDDAANSFVEILKNDANILEYTTPPHLIRFVSNFVKTRPINRVLDPASGSGSLLTYLKMVTECSEAIGFDTSNQIISEASKLFPELKLQHGSTATKFDLGQSVDLIISDLPMGVRLQEPMVIGGGNKIRMVGDAILFNSIQHLSDDGMAIFLSAPSILNRTDSSIMIDKLEQFGIHLNGVISIEKVNRPRTNLNCIMLIFSREENNNTFFSGCQVSDVDKVVKAFNSAPTESRNHKWALREKFIGFNQNNIPLIDDAKMHRENLESGLRSSSSLYEYQTLGDIVLDYGFCKGESLSENLVGRNTLYLRKSNPISTTDFDKASEWKHGVAIVLDNTKVKNEYLEYLFSRTVGRYMIDTITSGSAIKSIRRDKLMTMPLLIPSLEVQATVLSIRNLIDSKTLELEKLKQKLNDLDDLERIKHEIRELQDGVENIDQLLFREEDSRLEFKSSLWRHFKDDSPIENQKDKSLKLEDSVIKTICAFLNSEGGTLLIGVSDNKSDNGQSKVTGIEHDYEWCKSNNRNSDGFGQAIESIIKDKLSSSMTPLTKHITKSFHEVDGGTICRIDVTAAPRNGHGYAVFAKISTQKEKRLFIRSGETTTMQSPESQTNYIMSHFVGLEDEG